MAGYNSCSRIKLFEKTVVGGVFYRGDGASWLALWRFWDLKSGAYPGLPLAFHGGGCTSIRFR